ncbi:hypothetical protein SPKIRA_29690 [Sphingomonas paucimobilis]|jgi:RNA polymerase sigma-70 factor (ECF subfamily)|uniref:DNA, contig: SP664 n=3 Tax=Pseudomonadota TaxID=1224 RepID=A0A0C9MYT9_SPHPI|nr:RNA polymerase sigma factor [Sphingomonas paucimobilis]BCI72139.1 hypothetical protein SPKIRA_29690 [Sphingomonas paucimobilis]GAN15746.1 putative RNA polymerase ECF-type sigma factor [Sphingomonas paucimobilis NBRC 13935]SUJ35301.1 RNA polymerase sigma factor [Sphingomonas paucimobilis]
MSIGRYGLSYVIRPNSLMIDDDALKRWFVADVLPLERDLERYLARHCRARDDVIDLRQEVYEHAVAAARKGLPLNTRPFVLTVARNLLIDRARRAKVVSFEQMADLDELNLPDLAEADRALTARDELRRAMAGLDQLPPRCREVVRLRRVEGLNIRETAARLGVGHHTVERQLTLGLRALANFMLGGNARIERKPGLAPRRKRTP